MEFDLASYPHLSQRIVCLDKKEPNPRFKLICENNVIPWHDPPEMKTISRLLANALPYIVHTAKLSLLPSPLHLSTTNIKEIHFNRNIFVMFSKVFFQNSCIAF